MKRIFSSPVFALAAGLCLRLFFVLKFPADSGDTAIYEQIAANWLKHHVYAMEVQGAITPVDLRMPGYPAFLALIYALTGRTVEAARLWVMLAQVAVDLSSALIIAVLAAGLLVLTDRGGSIKRVFNAALWLAALCPFTANYTAVLLTETIATFWTALGVLFLTGVAANSNDLVFPKSRRPWEGKWSEDFGFYAPAAGLAAGLGALFRPETPLLLLAAWISNAFLLLRHRKAKHLLRITLFTTLGCVLPLAPWAIRNARTFHEVQWLTPKYSTLPGEIVPRGLMAWESTWLFRVKDCYLVPWKINEEAIDVDTIPARAFDSPEEKQRVSAILKPYNEDLSLTEEEDDAFGQLARERAARHPLRTYLGIPAARAVVLWFTPRIELLPISGNVFPLAEKHDTDPADQGFTIFLFLLNIVYLGLGAGGAVKLWRASAAVRPALVFLILFLLLRTGFLTTLETPEPRYVLVCFPILIALAAQLFSGKPEPQSSAAIS
ncbi:MAG TPA: hypothetical protein VKB90_10995 [Candidatus Acidoferrum sp.]|nr:hypothetical protein [Candidatus Acidoferrum sp.]